MELDQICAVIALNFLAVWGSGLMWFLYGQDAGLAKWRYVVILPPFLLIMVFMNLALWH